MAFSHLTIFINECKYPTSQMIAVKVIDVIELDLAICFSIFEWYQDDKPLDQSDEVLRRNRDEP